MMNKQRGLGKGLDALFDTLQTEVAEPDWGVREIWLSEIDPNPNQPRRIFDPTQLQQLADSIAQHGVVQPVIVEAAGNRYRLVAGERRWRAARMAGLSVIPAILRSLTTQQQMEISLIENLQREDLNPVEEAQALQAVLEAGGYTQEELAKRVGRSRPAVANILRLLQLPIEILELLEEGQLSEGHGRTLLSWPEEERIEMARKAAECGWSVRQLEQAVQQSKIEKPKKAVSVSHSDLQPWEDAVGRRLGTKVRIQGTQDKGRMTIEYFQRADLERVLTALGVTETET